MADMGAMTPLNPNGLSFVVIIAAMLILGIVGVFAVNLIFN
jgi:hypothetical protein